MLQDAQDFVGARSLFERAARQTGNGLDAPSAICVQRCLDLAESPPGPDWDQVYLMRHK